MYIYFVSIQYTQYTPTAILTPSGKVAAMPGPKSLKAALVGANMVKGPTPAAPRSTWSNVVSQRKHRRILLQTAAPGPCSRLQE